MVAGAISLGGDDLAGTHGSGDGFGIPRYIGNQRSQPVEHGHGTYQGSLEIGLDLSLIVRLEIAGDLGLGDRYVHGSGLAKQEIGDPGDEKDRHYPGRPKLPGRTPRGRAAGAQEP